MSAEPVISASFFVRVLGRFAVEIDGVSLLDRSWSRRKAQAIVKLLALRDGHSAHREEVLDALWPELDPSAALNNLYKNLHHLRSALTAKGVQRQLVVLNGEMVELAPGTLVDAAEFRRLARQALVAADVALMEQAASLYRGDLLPEDSYEEWTAGEREQLRASFVELLFAMARAYESAANHAACIETLQTLLRHEPLNEEAHRLLISQFAHSGSRHRALRQFQMLSDLMRSELGVSPSPETLALYDSLTLAAPASRKPEPAPQVDVRQPQDTAIRPTFGRDQELSRIETLVDLVESGQGNTLLIWGEAGVGKSHLVEQVLADVSERGFLTAVARCSELEASAAYQPFRDVLRRVVADAGAEALLRRSYHLQRVVFGTSDNESAQDASLFQAELLDEALRLVQAVSQKQPLLICLEDFHEADEGSIRLFHYLTRRLSGLRALLIATFRIEGRRTSGLSGLVASLHRERFVTEIELRALNDQAMALLVEHLFGPPGPDAALLRDVLRHAEGNPLFASEIVHTLKQEQWARLQGGRWTKVGPNRVIIPGAVNDLLDIRLSRLSPTALDLVQLAAIQGRDVDYALLLQAAGMGEREALDALDECIASHLIDDSTEGYRFRHDLVREGIYERVTRARRQSLHRTLAQAMSKRWPDPASAPQVESIARHYVLSNEPWLAAPYLLTAGRRAAAVYAHEQAAGFLEQLLSLTETHADHVEDRLRIAALELLGDIERRRGNTRRSVELFEGAQAALAERGELEAAARVRGKAALGHIILGNSEAARAQITATLRELTEASPQHVVARTYYLLAQLHWHGGENRQALEAAERSLIAAAASRDPAEKAQALEVMALACHSLGDWQRGVELELERQALGVPGFNTDEAFEAHL